MEREITNPALSESLRKLTGEAFLGNFVSTLITLILIAGSIIFLFLLLFGGIQWMLSGGDKAATEAARGRITSALVGLLIMFSAWAIIKLIETFLGINLISEPISLPGLGT